MSKLYQAWASSLAAASLVLCAGCSVTKDNAIFVTKTSFSLFDFDTTPGGVSIAYDRVEGYAGPRFVDGKVFPVASYIAVSGQGLTREVNQVYATGQAARIVTSTAEKCECDSPKVAPQTDDGKPTLFFATGTTIGLKLGFTQSTGLPSGLTFGYKRKELSIIPVDADRQPSVLATFNTDAGVEVVPASSTTDGAAAAAAVRPNAKFGVKQYFATGDAAVQLSARDEIRRNFQNAAVAGMTPLQTYYLEASEQSGIALNSMSCLMKLDDALLGRVWVNGDDLDIFRVPGAVGRIRAKPLAAQREQYLLEVKALLGAQGLNRTRNLQAHKDFVCKLSAPQT